MSFQPDQGGSPTDASPSRHETTASNKNRTRRPCDSCRRRKSRCEMSDGIPPCILCKFHRQECTFREDPQPRKRKAASLSEEENSHTRDVSRQSQKALDKPWLSTRSPGDTSQRLTFPSIRQATPIDDYANLRGPSLLKRTLGLQNRRHSRLVGSTSEHEQVLLELDDNNQDEIALGSSVLRKVNASDAFILAPDEGTQNHDDEVTDLDAIETLVAPHGQALIHLYFRIVHPSFPVLHKKVYLEKYQRTHREFSPPLLAAVYVLALNWWSYSSELALLPKPDLARLEKLASKTMNDVIHRPKLSTIQAGLLLLQRPEGDSWALTTQLVGLGQDLGLHLDCSNWNIPGWERGLRKRLAWGLFMQDKWGSLVHSRPSHITTDDWAVQSLNEDDFPENSADEDDEDGSTEVEKGRTLFCEMIELTKILAVIISGFYTLKAEADCNIHSRDGVRWVIERAKPSQLALKHWYAQLPAPLKLENVTMRKLSSTGYLHLGYYAVEITLHRRIIRSLSSVDDPSHITFLRSAARARLVSAMDFVQNLRPEHLQSFWYSSSKYCFALIGSFVSLLWATSLDKEEAEFYRAKLDEYRWTLRLSSKSADFLERAISTIATSAGVLVKVIPETPNVNDILNRNIRKRKSHSAPRPQSDNASQAQSIFHDYSESETHDIRTAENTPNDFQRTSPNMRESSDADLVADHFWFDNTPQMPDLDAELQHAFIEMPDIRGVNDAYNF